MWIFDKLSELFGKKEQENEPDAQDEEWIIVVLLATSQDKLRESIQERYTEEQQRELFDAAVSFTEKQGKEFVVGVKNILISPTSPFFANRVAWTLSYSKTSGESLEEIYRGENQIPLDYLVVLLQAIQKQKGC